MADNYSANQKRIIRQRIQKFLPSFFTILFLVSLVFGAILCGLLPSPHSWKSEDITIVDIQYLKKPRGFARYARSGYELTDSNGNIYWIAGELTWRKEGQTYTVTYAQETIYRHFKAISHNGKVLKPIDTSIAAWERDSHVYVLILGGCAIVYIGLFVQLYKELHHPEILACKKRIFAHEAKMQRRALEKQRR